MSRNEGHEHGETQRCSTCGERENVYGVTVLTIEASRWPLIFVAVGVLLIAGGLLNLKALEIMPFALAGAVGILIGSHPAVVCQVCGTRSGPTQEVLSNRMERRKLP